MAPASDVGALVLTLGERSTARAIASVRSQTLPIHEIVVLEGVTPFHRALNRGAALMSSPFFLQVDADFVLDSACAAVLRGAMAGNLAMTVGALNDTLIGPVAGIKLFRRRCFSEVLLKDTVAREVDFLYELEQRGWLTRYVVGHICGSPTNTLGKHEPTYTVDYAYGTYYLLGARYAHRGDIVGIQWRLGQLRASRHPIAQVARVAMAHGMFAGELRDVPKPLPARAHAEFLHRLASGSGGRHRSAHDGLRRHGPKGAPAAIRRLASLSPTGVVDAFVELGASLRDSLVAPGGYHSLTQFRNCLSALAEINHPHTWIAEAALGHGALAGAGPPIPEPTLVTFERLAAAQTSHLFPRPA